MFSWNTSDIEHVTTTEGWANNQRRNRLEEPARLKGRTHRRQGDTMKITVETVVKAELNQVWDVWNSPAHIKQCNTAQDDWHTTRSSVDLREGGAFLSRMEAEDGSEGFDFEGTYNRIVPQKVIEYHQRTGWQAILDNFGRHVEASG
jgi:uncharacterized protein YndB with AHSA1/START domain